ncbi:sterol desaturase family protein [Azotobacter salinestris]|uniref:sterol desaturase family protein n=1 Tax=Azotobacter salinestris TaxID=69964 RepID=UPI001266E410|nr:sterol desaturase family protein [Azotobacter salinestris]
MSTETIRDAFGLHALPWLGVVLLALVGIACVEGLVRSLWRPGSYDWRASAASMADALIRRGVDALGLSLAAPAYLWAYQHRLQTLELSTPAAFVLLFLGQEFLYYWYHRAAHRVRWFWASHSVHHSPNQLNLAAALRLGWTGKLTGSGLFFVPLVWLGFPPLAVTAAVALNLIYQFWVHAPWMPRLGPLEWVLNTPTHHKVHHASNREYLDCNYGGVLIVFDRLFGTFVEHRPEIPIRYGLTRPLHSYNPLRIALHGWLELGRDLLRARGPRARLKVLVGRP